MDSFDQASRQPERPAQPRFCARHFTIISLVVEACQVQDSVQRKNLDFLACGMPQADRIVEGNVGGDSHIASQLWAFAGFRFSSR